MAEKDPKDPHPGMMGDGTEEQNLNQPGDPSKRITEEAQRKLAALEAKEKDAATDDKAPADAAAKPAAPETK